jgi:uncharacterized delta-60 repeat protein
MQRIHKGWLGGLGTLLLGGAFLAACGSDGTSDPVGTGGSMGGDSATGGLGGDSNGTGGASGGGAGEGGLGGGPSAPAVTNAEVPGGYNLYGLTYSSTGQVYVSGTKDVGGEPMVAVWRYEANGTPDTTFGENGVALRNLGAGAEGSYGVLELSNGDLVVHGAFGGRVYLFKLDDTGALVTAPTYVEFGWSLADLAALPSLPDATEWNSATPPSYTSWGIALDTSGASERVVVTAFGAPRKGDVNGSDEQRIDNDRWLARVLASDFSADPTFNGGQALGVDVEGANLADNTRRVLVEADGTIVQAGYTNFGSGNEVGIMRVLPNGTLDPSFGFGTLTDQDGLTRFNPFTGPGAMAEAYAIVKGPARYVATGYGISNFQGATSVANDVVSFGIELDGSGLDADGFGDSGAWAILSEADPVAQQGTWTGGTLHRDNGRDLVALSDGRTLHVGCYNDYAAVFMFRAAAELDQDFGSQGMIVLDAASEYGTHNKPYYKAALSPDGTRVAASSQGGLLSFFVIE